MPTIDRRALRFAEVVEKDFGFLSAHGFERVRSEPTLVRFESKRACVNIYHGRKSYEIGLEIGPLEGSRPDESHYSMSEIIRLGEPAKGGEYRNYATRDANGVEGGVRRLADLFRRYVDAGVFDDASLFVRLGKQRRTWKQDFAREVSLKQARRQLDVAWNARDYAMVVELLEPLRADLTSSELKKLGYAKKRLLTR